MTVLFAGTRFQDFAEQRKLNLLEEINGFSEDYLSGIAEDELVNYLICQYEMDPPVLGDPFIDNSCEVKVDVSCDPQRYIRDRSRPFHITGQSIEVHVPFEGKPGYFNVTPSHASWNPPAVDEIHSTYLKRVFTGAELKSTDIKGDLTQLISQIRSHLETLRSDCTQFNQTLEPTIRQAVSGRIARHAKNRELVEGVGLPIRRRENAPQTYALPTIRRRVALQKPQLTAKASSPEPILSSAEFETILSIIRSMVSVIERSANAFRSLVKRIFDGTSSFN